MKVYPWQTFKHFEFNVAEHPGGHEKTDIVEVQGKSKENRAARMEIPAEKRITRKPLKSIGETK